MSSERDSDRRASSMDVRPQGAVYFPYINAPDNDWFVRTLLYWDEIACIMPPGYNPWDRRNRPRVRPDGRTPAERFAHTVELADAQLIRLLEPELPADETWPFVQGFLSLVENDPSFSERRAWATSARPGISVHRGKLGDLLLRHLGRIGLAREPDGPWVKVEPETASLFMACLASYLGDTQPLPLRPVTDDPRSYAAVQRILTPREALADAGARDVILNEVLPAPSVRGLSWFDVAEFKHDHAQELRDFRRSVEAGVRRIASIPDPTIRHAEAEETGRDLAERVAELDELMRARGWTQIKTTTLNALAIAAPSGLALSGHPTASAAAGLTGLAAIAYGILRPSDGPPSNDPLAYAVGARRLAIR